MFKTKIHKDDIIYGDLGKIVLPSSDKTETFQIENDPREPAFIKRKDRWLLSNRNSWNVNNHLLGVLKRVQVEEDGIYKKRIRPSAGVGNNKSNYFDELPIKRAYEPASVLYAKQVEKRRNEPKKEEYRRNGIFLHKDLNGLYFEKMSEASIDENINIRESTNVPSSTTHELILTLLDKNKDVLHEEKIDTNIKKESITHAFKIEELASANNIDAHEVDSLKTTINIEHDGVHLKEEKSIKVIGKRYVLHFRSTKNYTGDFGFDWLRIGDTKRWYDKKYTKFLVDADDYDAIKKQYEKEPKLKENNQDLYYMPKLTIYPNTTVSLSLIVNKNLSDELLKKVEFTSSSDKIKIELTSTKEISVKCSGEFSSDAVIEAKLDNKLIGKMQILANAVRHDLDILLIQVEMTLNKKSKKVFRSENDLQIIRNPLKQAYITANIIEFDGMFQVNKEMIEDRFLRKKLILKKTIYSLNPYMDLNDCLEPLFNKAYPKYENTIKVFYLGESKTIKIRDKGKIKKLKINGESRDVNSTSIVIYKGGNNIAHHEVFHALGLYHTFDKKSTYPLKKQNTQNIMDYARKKTYSWVWQWEILQKYFEEKEK